MRIERLVYTTTRT